MMRQTSTMTIDMTTGKVAPRDRQAAGADLKPFMAPAITQTPVASMTDADKIDAANQVNIELVQRRVQEILDKYYPSLWRETLVSYREDLRNLYEGESDPGQKTRLRNAFLAVREWERWREKLVNAALSLIFSIRARATLAEAYQKVNLSGQSIIDQRPTTDIITVLENVRRAKQGLDPV